MKTVFSALVIISLVSSFSAFAETEQQKSKFPAFDGVQTIPASKEELNQMSAEMNKKLYGDSLEADKKKWHEMAEEHRKWVKENENIFK